MMEIQVVKDPKKEIEFWINTLSQPRLDEESIRLLNQGLQASIRLYLYPITYISMSKTI